MHFFSSGFGGSLDLPPVDTGVSEASRGVTVFGHRYGLVIVDEIAEYRKIKKESAALKALRERAFGAIGMTATPIINGPMVSMASGR